MTILWNWSVCLSIFYQIFSYFPAKTSSLQDIPRTALGAKRQEELLTIAKEIEHVKHYKLQQKNIISTVLPESCRAMATKEKRKEALAKLNSPSVSSVISVSSSSVKVLSVASPPSGSNNKSQSPINNQKKAATSSSLNRQGK